MIKVYVWAAFSLLIGAGIAHAEKTEWISGKTLWMKTPSLSSDQMLPATIECRDSGSRNLNLDAVDVRFDRQKAEAGKRWHWWVFWERDDEADIRDDMARRGFHIASKSSVTRKSGVVITCYLFRN